MYYLYLHTMPDGKIYIGQTRQELDKRWSGGDGYILNAKFYNAIKKVGWENIKHEVLGVFETQEEVDLYEKLFIVYFNSEDSNKRTSPKNNSLRMQRNNTSAHIGCQMTAFFCFSKDIYCILDRPF